MIQNMIKRPKVSVVIPVYNVSKYIETCARSLFEQTLDDMEYLFVDDCTPDNSIEILERVLKDYPNRINQVHIIKMPMNSGQAAVRKKGILSANGEYLIHCDSDDWVDTNAYKYLYDYAKEISSDILFFEHKRVSNNKTLYYKRDIPCKNKVKLVSQMLSGYNDANQLWGALVHYSLYKTDIKYPLNNQGEDSVIMLQYILGSTNMSIVHKYLYNYRQNPSSITKSNDAKINIKRTEDRLANRKLFLSIVENCNKPEYKSAIEVCRFRIRRMQFLNDGKTWSMKGYRLHLLLNPYFWYYLYISNNTVNKILRIFNFKYKSLTYEYK